MLLAFKKVTCCLGHPVAIDIEYNKDFPFINIHVVQMEVLKTWGEAQDFQHFPRNLANDTVKVRPNDCGRYLES